IKITVANRGPEAANLRLLPTVWFRNTWSWGSGDARPKLFQGKTAPDPAIQLNDSRLGNYRLYCEGSPELLFTENETNAQRLFGAGNPSPYVKDSINDYVVRGSRNAVNPALVGTKAAAHYRLTIAAGESVTVRLRLTNSEAKDKKVFEGFDRNFKLRKD